MVSPKTPQDAPSMVQVPQFPWCNGDPFRNSSIGKKNIFPFFPKFEVQKIAPVILGEKKMVCFFLFPRRGFTK